VKILGRADLAREMGNLDTKLDILYRTIVNRLVTSVAVGNIRTDCNEYFLALEDYKQELLDSPSNVDQELAGSISNLNKHLRTVREALGQLIEILKMRDESPSSRRAPSGFERKHGTAESAIEHILPEIRLITREYGGTAGFQEHNRRRHGGTRQPGSTDNRAEYRQRRYRDPEAREYRRLIS
jgi:hypothetical protein